MSAEQVLNMIEIRVVRKRRKKIFISPDFLIPNSHCPKEFHFEIFEIYLIFTDNRTSKTIQENVILSSVFKNHAEH